MPRVLITGGAGFLGSHLCDKFIGEGYDVVALDNLITGTTDNIAHLMGNERFLFVKHDVTNHIYVDGKIDYVLHFASPASPVDYLEKPIQTLKVGSLGAHKTLGLAKEKGARFLFASSSEIYGDPQVDPQDEGYWGHVNPIGQRSCYDEAKRFGEAMTMGYHRVHGVDTRIARIFNTYGQRMRARDGRVVSNFIVQALIGEPITVYGDGTQTRSFCHVSDQIDGLYRLLQSEETDPVNIGNPDEMSVGELAVLIREMVGSNSPIEHEPLPTADDPKMRCPDISKAKQVLRWEPKVSLREGLAATIAYFKKVLQL
jgi:dTDP-glucose 4,6-dehydratase